MWYHPLDAMEKNKVTEKQQALGWENADRLGIMRHYYSSR
jgi:hypothetical protein